MLTMITLILFAVLLGAAFCFAGYRFFLVLLPILGFFAGFWLGGYSTSLLLGTGFLATVASLVVAVVVGIIGAVLSYLFYMAGVVIVAAAFGGAVGSGVMSALGFDAGLIMALVTIVSAVVAAGLTLLLNVQKLVIVLFTAMAGSSLFVLAGTLILGQVTVVQLQAGGNFLRPVFQGSWLWGLVWLVLTAAGVVIQFRTNRTYEFSKEAYVEGWG